MKRRGVILVLLACMLLSGCWSSSPIEDVNMMVGVALDSPDETGTEEENDQKGGQYPKRNKISSTYQFIIPQGAVGSKKGGAQSENYYSATETKESIFEALREFSLRSNRPPVGHHLKIIVIGEELARTTKLSELIDFYARDNDIRPSVLLLISKGKAREVMSHALPGQTPSFVLTGIFNNRYRNNKMWEPVSIAKAVGPLHGHTSFLLQSVFSLGKEPKFSGAAVIKGETGKLGGFLNESELDGLTWLTGKGQGGVIKTYDQDNGSLISYEIKSMHSKIKAHVKGGQISFHVKIESSGRFAEAFYPGSEKINDGIMKRAKQAFQKQVEDKARATVEKMQHELHVDVAGFGKSLHTQHPAAWNKVKEGWDETFSHLPVTYEVNINIEENGASGITSE